MHLTYRIITVAAVLALASASPAQTIGVGVGTHTRSVSISATQPVYKLGSLAIYPEVGYVQWRVSGDTGYQAYATPTFRYPITQRVGVTAGIGASVFSRTSWGDKNTSTKFQFADHVGVTYQLSDTYGINVRYVHASNAGIKQPNPSVDSVQVNLTASF